MPEVLRIKAYTPYDEIKKEAYAWYQIDENVAKALFESFGHRIDECISFARSINLYSPEDFCSKVFVLATGEFPGVLIEKKKPGKEEYEDFFSFVRGMMQEILNMEVQDTVFIRKFGRTKKEIVEGIGYALDNARDTTDLIIALNSVSPELGKKFFSAWLLKKKGLDVDSYLEKQFKRIASLRNRITRFIKWMSGGDGFADY